MNQYLIESLLVLFAILKTLDAITTYIGMKYRGAKELNPLGRWMFDRFGLVPSLAAITVVAIALAFYFYYTTEAPIVVFGIANAAFLMVVVNNFIMIRRGI